MIASWPKKIKTNTTSDHISAFWDVLPTLCDVAGKPIPEATDGISFLPELLGTDTQKSHEFLYWEFPAYGGQQAVRMKQWKGIRKDIFKGNKRIELYDLQADPREQNNIASKNPDIVSKIEQIMDDQHKEPAVKSFRIKSLGDTI